MGLISCKLIKILGARAREKVTARPIFTQAKASRYGETDRLRSNPETLCYTFYKTEVNHRSYEKHIAAPVASTKSRRFDKNHLGRPFHFASDIRPVSRASAKAAARRCADLLAISRA